MSNYRVRQVLALGRMPESHLRLLVALATYLPDETRTAKVSVEALTEATGNVRNTVRKARRELEKEGKLTSESSRGRGHLTVWTVNCLPEKGGNDADPDSSTGKGGNDADPVSDSGKGVNSDLEKGSIPPEKRGQPERADLQKTDQGLNRLAKPSDPRARAMLQAIDPAVTWQIRYPPQPLTSEQLTSPTTAHERAVDEASTAQIERLNRSLAAPQPLASEHPTGSEISGSESPSGPVAAALAMLRAVDATVTAAETESILSKLTENGARSAIAVLRTAIREGSGRRLVAEARGELPSPVSARRTCDRDGESRHSDACRRGDGRSCTYVWCECRCHGRKTVRQASPAVNTRTAP